MVINFCDDQYTPLAQPNVDNHSSGQDSLSILGYKTQGTVQDFQLVCLSEHKNEHELKHLEKILRSKLAIVSQIKEL